MSKKIVGTIDGRLLQSSEKLLDVMYPVTTLAKKLDVSPRYIRRALIANHGAPHIKEPNGRILVNGKEFQGWVKQFLEDEADAKKKKPQMQENEFYCVKCRSRVFVDDYYFENDGTNNFYKGICPVCGTRVNKYLHGNDGKKSK